MEEEDVLEMSGEHSGSDQGTNTTDDHDVHLPAYLAYLSLGFRVITTVITVLMAGWVIITIKTARSLHKTHNIFVAQVMATDAISAVTHLILSGIMMIGYFTDTGDFISCNVLIFLLFPVIVTSFTFLLISVDKVIAVTFPLRYREIMKPRVVFGMITTTWVLAVVVSIRNLFNSKGFTKVAQFGNCQSNERTPSELLTFVLPIFLSCFLSAILNVYLTIKAYQVHKNIKEESELSGGHSGEIDRLKALKKKQATIKKHLKPMITLLVVVFGSLSIGMIFPLLYYPVLFLASSSVYYERVLRYVVGPNIGFLNLVFHPFVYGLYFKQIREPMMRLLKRITRTCKCKSATVAPQPQRNRITWLNPN